MMILIWKLVTIFIKQKQRGVVTIWWVVYRQRWSMQVLDDHLLTILVLLLHSLKTARLFLCLSFSWYVCVFVTSVYVYINVSMTFCQIEWMLKTIFILLFWGLRQSLCRPFHNAHLMQPEWCQKVGLPSVNKSKTYFHIRLLWPSYQSPCVSQRSCNQCACSVVMYLAYPKLVSSNQNDEEEKKIGSQVRLWPGKTYCCAPVENTSQQSACIYFATLLQPSCNIGKWKILVWEFSTSKFAQHFNIHL